MKIDLGTRHDEMDLKPMSPDMEMPKKHYPSFTYDGPDELGIPKEGTMTVSYKEVRSSTSDSDGKKHYSCTIEVRDILDVEAERDERPARSHDESSAALDKLLEEKRARKQSKSERY